MDTNEVPQELSEEPSLPQKKHSLTNFLIVYFDFVYFLCCCPFRFVSDQHGQFHVKSNLLQKIICAFLNTLGLFFKVRDFRAIMPGVSDYKSPLRYFDLLNSLFSISFQLLTLKRFWRNQNDFLDVVNYIRSEEKALQKKNMRIQRKIFSRLICSVFATMALYEVIWKKILAPASLWNESFFNRHLIKDAHYMFFINANNSQPEPSSWSGFDAFLAFFVSFGWIERYLLGFFLDLSLLFAILTAWTASCLFSQRLETESEKSSHKLNSWVLLAQVSLSNKVKPEKESNDWQDVYHHYKCLRNLCQLINTAYGGMLTIYLADSILFHSMGMDTVLVTPDIIRKIRLMFFISNSTCTFVLSADTCHRLHSLRLWLGKDENRREIPMDQLNIVMNELQSNMIGIRGNDIFTVTYPLLWNVMTTVVTYFIICLQARQQEHETLAVENKTAFN